jgi:hypothetical protein
MFRNLFWRYGARPLLVDLAVRGLGDFAPRLMRRRLREFIAETTPPFLAPDPALRRELDERAERMLPGPRQGSAYLDQVPRYFDNPMVILLQEDNFEASRRIGVPMLSPFLDADVVEFACRVRPEDLYSEGRNKGLLRPRVAPRLPMLGYENQKKLPATSFMRRIVREQTEATWTATGGVPALAEMGIVEPRELRRTLDDIVTGRRLRMSNLSVFTFSLESWARAHDTRSTMSHQQPEEGG